MKQVRFPEGCAMSLYIPLILLPNDGNPIDPTKLTDLEASVSLHGVVTQITPSIADACIVLPLSADLKAGQYVITYSFKYDGRPFAGRWANVLEIVKDNAQSNWQGYIPEDGKATLEDQIFIAGPTMTDEELDQLKAEYVEKNKELQHAIDEYREKAESIEDIEGAKLAFNTMKRIQPYLYGIEYNSLNYEDARAHMLGASVMPSSCTTIKRGSEVGRNFDWTISKQVEFLVRTKAHNGRYATIGFCGALSIFTKDMVESGMYREEYRYLPFYMQDGMNSEGVVATIHQLPYNATRSQAAEGNTPVVDEREKLSAIMLVRYIVDNFKTATDAANYIRDFVRVIPANVGGKQTDCQYAIADKDVTIYLAFEGDSVIIEEHTADAQFVMTNFRLAGTSLVDGRYDIEQSGIEDYGQGVERANAAIDSDLDILSILAQEVNFTKAYTGLFLTEFAGMEHGGVRATIHNTDALTEISNAASDKYYAERSAGTFRENGDLWQSVHSVVYDLNAKTMRFLTQEIDGDAEPIVVDDPFATSGGGISHEQYEALAKQGDNKDATNSAILDKVGRIATDISAIDADVLQGKRKLAAAITQKGVRTAYTESLSDMAINVSAIPQTTYTGDSNFDAMVMPSEYMWNVYKIAENLIGNNPYPYANRFFVAEYYLGYDSLVLSGADAYLTCDGDYYEVMGEQCIHTRPDGTQEVLEGKDPNHIWHDSDNGKMNRYVVFFFQADTYTFSNTTAAICPRRVAISGNCASFVVTGENRLTDVWVLGTLGHFEGGTTGDSWNPAQVIRNYREHSGQAMYTDPKKLNSVVLPDLERILNPIFYAPHSGNNINTVYLPYITELSCTIINQPYRYLEVQNWLLPNLKRIVVTSNFDNQSLIGQPNPLCLPNLESIESIGLKTYGFSVLGGVREIVCPKLRIIDEIAKSTVWAGVAPFGDYSPTPTIKRIVVGSLIRFALNDGSLIGVNFATTRKTDLLEDFEVGEGTLCNLQIPSWNPISVIAEGDEGVARLVNNIRNHILDRVIDNSGESTQLIFSVSTNMFNAVTAADPNLVADFGAKGWSFRGA